MVCRDFILPEPASYVFFYAIFNLRKLLYIIGRLLSDNSMKGASKDACASGFLRMCDVRKTRSLQHESRNCIPVDLPWTCRCYTAY